ncbi:MAG: hypothetical protein ACFHWX_19665 [Bacteroidota bacterium]
MHLKELFLWIILLIVVLPALGQEITEVEYLDRAHFRIVTKNALYLYDQQGGGFSSIKDQDDIRVDWLSSWKWQSSGICCC